MRGELQRGGIPYCIFQVHSPGRGSVSGLGQPAAYVGGSRAVSGEASGSGVLLCLPGSAEGLRWYPLSEIEKPGSGTEPIHQEHMTCSRFRGSCPSDVKSAGHPEPGFPISLSGYAAALCPSEPDIRAAGRRGGVLPCRTDPPQAPGTGPLPLQRRAAPKFRASGGPPPRLFSPTPHPPQFPKPEEHDNQPAVKQG